VSKTHEQQRYILEALDLVAVGQQVQVWRFVPHRH